MGKKLAALIAFLALVAIGTTGCSVVSGGGTVNWLSDWDEALSEAQSQNKPILINFYTDLCPACRKMDQTTFTDDELGAFLNSNFICLRSNAGKSTLYTRYGISAVPTMIFTEPDGYEKQYEIARIVGYVNASEFYQIALDALEQWQT